MRVCLIASTYPRFQSDGAGRFVRSIAEALAAEGHEVHVLAPFHPGVAPFASPAHLHHFRYVWPNTLAIMGYAEAMDSDRGLRGPAYLLAPLFLLAEWLALWRLHRRYHFDLLHAHWVIPNGVAAAILARIYRLPLVISLHGSDVFVALLNPLLSAAARWAFRSAVTACSPDLLEGALTLGVPAARGHLLPWGADPDTFTAAVHTDALRAHWKLPAGASVVMCLGRLVEKKGISYLLQAAPKVLAACPDTRFLVVGDGPEAGTLMQQAAALGIGDRVVFTGASAWTDVPAYLALADLFVVPSVKAAQGNVDGMPTTILEAMAAGLPVIASRLAGIPLVVTHEGTGLLVDEKQPDQLAEAILRLLTNPSERLAYGRAARTRVENELNWRQVARQLSTLFEQAT
jgi:glycosyltransferase involved in cell wall biosynthesis